MNARERFLATMAFEPVDRPPLWEFGYWTEVLVRWYGEGLPHREGLPRNAGRVFGEGLSWDASLLPFTARDRDVHLELGFDDGIGRVPLNSFVYPPFERRVLEETGNVILVQDERGHIWRDTRAGVPPQSVRSPVETSEDWERFRAERLQPTLEGRLPADWPQQRENLRHRDFPLAIGGTGGQLGFFHAARYLLGQERLLFAFYDQPELLKEMMQYLAEFWVALLDRVLSEIDVDMAYLTEDIAYKAGPLISPAMFRTFLLPGYKKLTGMLQDHGVRIVFVDSDGNVWKLLPSFLEAGVTGLGPMEVAAGMDVAEVRQAFPRLQMLGGVDKRAVAEGPAAIDLELVKRLPGTVESGGYIPMLDHIAPPDIAWPDFVHYRKRLARMMETDAIPSGDRR